MWNDSIKIITGIRRCGKSFLLNNIFYDYLISIGVKEESIIRFAFDSALDVEMLGEDLVELQSKKLKVSYKKFISYINLKISSGEKYYLLLDEVQMLDCFEYVLNGYLQRGNIDIYVTGSNSKFLSSDVITEFRGRGDEIHLMPLSFSEFYDYVGGAFERRIDEYLTYGGLPRVVLSQTSELKMAYLTNQMDKTFLRDVIDRHGLKQTAALAELVNILASGISSLTNPRKLENRFKSEKNLIFSSDTINTYIQYLRESYILNKAIRYDIKGRKYISTPYKLYFEDLGLRNAKLDFRQVEFTQLMENLVYNELLYRGYKVDVWEVTLNNKAEKNKVEVDFVANNGNQRVYIQVLNSDKELSQEVKALESIKDSFKKLVIINKPIERKINENGIIFLSLEDFLLNKESYI